MKIISWNVNGLRSVIKNEGLKELLKLNPDFINLQEIKINEQKLKELLEKTELFKNYKLHFSTATVKNGYSGVLILTKTAPIMVTRGFIDNDPEGRILTLEFDTYTLVNVYFPHASRDLSKLEKKIEFNEKFAGFISKQPKPIIIMGDFNVAYSALDIERYKENMGGAGCTPQEREFFKSLLSTGFIDSFRYLRPNENKYTWWLQNFSARERNIGWRIDYGLVSKNLKPKLIGAEILNEVYGSDHCPISIELDI